MTARSLKLLSGLALATLCLTHEVLAADATQRNVVIFVADGLRYSAVTGTDTPTLFALRTQGVHFTNSHALFPTFTTPNASAIATGHLPGDTGDFGNCIYVGFPNAVNGSVTPFIEHDLILQEVDDHFANGNFLDETSLLAAARDAGYHTAALGKHGPTLIQDVTQGNRGVTPVSVIIDDLSGTSGEVSIPPVVQSAMTKAGLPPACPSRGANGMPGSWNTQGALVANTTQQQYFADALTKAILPTFVNDPANPKPFVIVYWSRDPDGTQHNQGDAFNPVTHQADQIGVGINGPSSKAAIANVDNNLAQIIHYLNATDDPHHPGHPLSANTDIFVTSDHGFGTISKHELDASGTAVIADYASQFTYHTVANYGTASAPNWTAVQDTVKGHVPAGFVAIDLAHALNLPLYDPDTLIQNTAPQGTTPGIIAYAPVDAAQPPLFDPATGKVSRRQHAVTGDAVIGGNGIVSYTSDGKRQLGHVDPDAKLIVAANGGSDLIYLPNASISDGHASLAVQALVRQVADFLASQPYVSGLFVDEAYGKVPGALSLADIGLKGSAQTPTPAIVINFRTFGMDPANPLYTGVEVADCPLQEGQGMHGTFSRFDTFNNMVAFGPDFKAGFVDSDPVSNADIAVTLAHVTGIKIEAKGSLTGRVLDEALAGDAPLHGASRGTVASEQGNSGVQTELQSQILTDSSGTHRYFDAAGFRNDSVNSK